MASAKCLDGSRGGEGRENVRVVIAKDINKWKCVICHLKDKDNEAAFHLPEEFILYNILSDFFRKFIEIHFYFGKFSHFLHKLRMIWLFVLM